MNPLKCGIRKAIETLQISEIQYASQNLSSFDPGLTPNEIKLTIKINSEGAFLKGTKVKLVLTSYKDPQNVIYKIDPITVSYKLDQTVASLSFDIHNKNIPIPHGVSYIHLSEFCNAELHIGNAKHYCFILYIKCCKCDDHHIIPFSLRYIGSDPIVDYKCEKIENTDDIENSIPILCDGQTVYYRKPHCVSHGQMKKPILLPYAI